MRSLDNAMEKKKHCEKFQDSQTCAMLNPKDLSSCAVLKECQGQRIGGEIIRYCLKKADAEGLPTYLLGFPKAGTLISSLFS
jgi:hypothetical protein